MVEGAGAGLGRTKRGGCCAFKIDATLVVVGKGSSCSIVGRGGVLGGEEGEGGSDEMVIASVGFIRRRLLVASAGSGLLVAWSSSRFSSSRSELVSSISSLSFAGGAAGKCGRRDIGEEYCVAGLVLSAACFCVELKLNFGAGANWDDEDRGAGCWKRREVDGWGIELVGFEVMKRCGDGVWVFFRSCEARVTVKAYNWRRRHGRRLVDSYMLEGKAECLFKFWMMDDKVACHV